jgi:hypothetical protein
VQIISGNTERTGFNIKNIFKQISLSRDYPFKRDLLTPEKLVVWGHSLGTGVAIFEGEKYHRL